jgi:8-oxo-dGTP pyrophosphatase MutT (NUDIX family)
MSPAGSGSPPPRDAATVILLRDGPAGVETFVLRRTRTMAFASGRYVFPGGRVDPRDSHREVPWSGPAPADFADRLDTGEPLARALVCAAVREMFEESGVLLAGCPGPAGDGVVADTSGDDWEADRRALVERTLPFSGLLVRRRLVLRAELLRCWARWITPEVEPLRYDTRFFVAALPAGQRTREVGGESDQAVWIRPVEALDRWSRGEMAMLPPTHRTLEELCLYDTVAAVLAAAENRRIPPIRPKAVRDDGGLRFLLPGDPGYDA